MLIQHTIGLRKMWNHLIAVGRGEYLSLLHYLSGPLAPDVESSHYSGAGVTISHPCNTFMDRWAIARLSSDPRMGIQYVDYWGPVMDC